MNNKTKAEQLFGKRSKDLNEKELREYYKLLQRERRKRPDVQEYVKRIAKEYQKNNREKINQAKREWNRKNPDKIKKYRNASFKREIALLEKALELACLSMNDKWFYCKYKDKLCPPEHSCLNLVMEYFKEQAKEIMKSE